MRETGPQPSGWRHKSSGSIAATYGEDDDGEELTHSLESESEAMPRENESITPRGSLP